MSWEELYPTITDQAYYAVLRYDPRGRIKFKSSFAKPMKNISMTKQQVRKSKNKIINALLLNEQKKLIPVFLQERLRRKFQH